MKILFLALAACLAVSSYAEEHEFAVSSYADEHDFAVSKRGLDEYWVEHEKEFHPIGDIADATLGYYFSIDPLKVADLLGMDSSKIFQEVPIFWNPLVAILQKLSNHLRAWVYVFTHLHTIDRDKVDLPGLRKYLGLHQLTRDNLKEKMSYVCRRWYWQLRYTLEKHAKNFKGYVKAALDKIFPIVHTVMDLVPVHCYSDDDCSISQCCGHHSKYFKGHGLCVNVHGEGGACNVKLSCGCAPGLQCNKVKHWMDVLHLNYHGVCAAIPTPAPTEAPTAAPTEAPTAAPTEAPTEAPTAAPTEAPTAA